MQPYIFPYIGYFQLINTVDRFVFLDDVNYINRGWINRNNILVNGKANMFTVPLQNASQNRLINEVKVAEGNWKDKILKTIEMAYKKAPEFKIVFPLIRDVFSSGDSSIAAMARQSIKQVCTYLEILTEFIDSSERYGNKHLKGEERIIDINVQENSINYVNPIGGMELYRKENFATKGINLYFLQTKKIIYPQFNNEFVPSLSIIDVLMFNAKECARQYLMEHGLIN
jgi:hypothetical protein